MKSLNATIEDAQQRGDHIIGNLLTEANLRLNEATEQLGVVNGQQTADSSSVERAEEKERKARHNAQTIMGYMHMLQTPAEERTKEESETLEKVYDACR